MQCVVPGNYRNAMFVAKAAGPEKHGISVQVKSWFTLVSRFHVECGSGELQKYHVCGEGICSGKTWYFYPGQIMVHLRKRV